MEVFRQLCLSLASGEVAALVIGGHAVGALARKRFTHDVDVLIAAASEEALTVALGRAGYRRLEANTLVIRYVHDDLMQPPVDALLVNEPTFAKLWEDSLETEIEGASVRIPSATNLVSLKLHAMRQDPRRVARDAADIADIVSKHPDAFPAGSLQKQCERFGGPGMWATLQPLLPPFAS